MTDFLVVLNSRSVGTLFLSCICGFTDVLRVKRLSYVAMDSAYPQFLNMIPIALIYGSRVIDPWW